MNIEDIIRHIRSRPYMSGVERSQQRILERQEVFTPTILTIESLSKLDNSYFADPEQEFIDPCCGDGTLLGETLILKCQNGIPFETALKKIKGMDIETSNVEATKERLLCGRKDLRNIVDKNIIQGDALQNDLLWGKPTSFGPNDLFTILPSEQK
jgi:hypothetical protein